MGALVSNELTIRHVQETKLYESKPKKLTLHQMHDEVITFTTAKVARPSPIWNQSMLTLVSMFCSIPQKKFTFTFSISDLFSKCDQIRMKLRIWSHLLKK